MADLLPRITDGRTWLDRDETIQAPMRAPARANVMKRMAARV
jgi:hypothetical protein